MEGNFHPLTGICLIRKMVISVSIGEEINQPGGIPSAGDILTLSGMSHPHSGYLPVLDGHPGSVLRKLGLGRIHQGTDHPSVLLRGCDAFICRPLR